MRSSYVLWIVTTALFAIGCGESAKPTATSETNASGEAVILEVTPGFVAERPESRYDDPRQAVNDFLVAVKSGDEKTATALLTTAAQKEAWSNGMAISGDGFPDAKFDISEVEYLKEKSEAHVMSTWSDRTPDGQQKSFQCVWLLRAEVHGWCIYGMAAKFLDTLQPIVLNFENQAEMAKRQQWAEQQIRSQRELEAHQRHVIAEEQNSQQKIQQTAQQRPNAQLPNAQRPVAQQAQLQSPAHQQASQNPPQSGQVPLQRQPVRQANAISRLPQ